MFKQFGESALTSILSAHQLRATITDDYTYCGRWRDREPATPYATFHLLASGKCEIESAVIEKKIELGSGDLILFPRGSAHSLCSVDYDNGATAADDTVMLCGELDFASGLGNPILKALPDCVIVRGYETETRFGQLAHLMCQVSRAGQFGRQVILDKLADALFVMAVHHYVAQAPNQRGLLAALTDRKLAMALDSMHSRIGEDWSIERLADVSCMSRTSFATRFSEVIGTSPHQYLTEARMTEALRLLRDPRLSTALIASSLGYQSEAAFRRAFTRVHGQGPGVFRKSESESESSQETIPS